MRAVGFRRAGGPEVLEVLEVPEPSDDALVIDAIGGSVNPVDLATRSGQIPTSGTTMLGWDVAGVVRTAPAGSGFVTGDHVMALTAPLGTGVGAHAERVGFDPALTVHLPPGLDPLDAATLPLVGVTAVQALRVAAVPAGARVLVVGAQGGVGSHLAARLLTAANSTVDVLVRPSDVARWNEHADGRAQVFGDPDRVGIEDYDTVIDTAGLPDLLAAVRPGGRFVTITPFSMPDPASRPGVTVSLVGVEIDRADLADVAAFAASGHLPPTTVTTMPFERAADAHRLVGDGRHRGKIVLTP